MRITRLHLHNVKRHADLELELAPGLTVVRGPNEAGKSTIQRAIEIALFRKPTSAAQQLDGVRRWGADDDPLVELDFEEEGEEGQLVKRFAGSRGTVELRFQGENLTDPTAVEEVISRLTGLPSEKFYRATASIHHHELTGLEQDEATLRDRLQQSMSGADKGTRAARRKLEEAIRRYRTEGQKNPGYLKVARSEVERLSQAVDDGEAALVKLERDRQALVDAREKRADLDDQLSQYRQALEASERALKLAERAEEARGRYERYRRAQELGSEVIALEAARPAGIPLAELRAAVERIRDQEFRLSEIRAEIAAEPDPTTYDAVVAVPSHRPLLLLAGLLLVAAVGGLLVGFVLDQLLVGLVLAGVLLLAGLGLALVAFRRRAQARQLQGEVVLQEIDIARRLRGRSDRTEQLREAERRRDEAVAALGLSDLAAAQELLEKEVEHQARIDESKAELRGLLGDESAEQNFAALRDQAAAEAAEYRHALDGMGRIGTEPEQNHARFAAAVDKAISEREQALTGEAEAKARLEGNTTDAEEVAGLTESLEAANERLTSLERRLRVYETVLTTLDNAEQGTMKKAARFLEESMAADVERITDGRYRRLQVDEARLSFSVFSVERGDWVEARGSLSQGTLDQLYLCARLGIVRQVTQPATPPIILDDPFVTFDDERARRGVELLRRVADDYQIILLSCSERYDELADKVITIDGPQARDAEVVPAEIEASEAAADLEPIELEPSGAGTAEAQPTVPQPELAEHEVATSQALEWPAEDKGRVPGPATEPEQVELELGLGPDAEDTTAYTDHTRSAVDGR